MGLFKCDAKLSSIYDFFDIIKKNNFIISKEDKDELMKYFTDNIILVDENGNLPSKMYKISKKPLYYGKKIDENKYEKILFKDNKPKKYPANNLDDDDVSKLQFNILPKDLLNKINSLKSICVMKKIIDEEKYNKKTNSFLSMENIDYLYKGTNNIKSNIKNIKKGLFEKNNINTYYNLLNKIGKITNNKLNIIEKEKINKNLLVYNKNFINELKNINMLTNKELNEELNEELKEISSFNKKGRSLDIFKKIYGEIFQSIEYIIKYNNNESIQNTSVKKCLDNLKYFIFLLKLYFKKEKNIKKLLKKKSEIINLKINEKIEVKNKGVKLKINNIEKSKYYQRNKSEYYILTINKLILILHKILKKEKININDIKIDENYNNENNIIYNSIIDKYTIKSEELGQFILAFKNIIKIYNEMTIYIKNDSLTVDVLKIKIKKTKKDFNKNYVSVIKFIENIKKDFKDLKLYEILFYNKPNYISSLNNQIEIYNNIFTKIDDINNILDSVDNNNNTNISNFKSKELNNANVVFSNFKNITYFNKNIRNIIKNNNNNSIFNNIKNNQPLSYYINNLNKYLLSDDICDKINLIKKCLIYYNKYNNKSSINEDNKYLNVINQIINNTNSINTYNTKYYNLLNENFNKLDEKNILLSEYNINIFYKIIAILNLINCLNKNETEKNNNQKTINYYKNIIKAIEMEKKILSILFLKKEYLKENNNYLNNENYKINKNKQQIDILTSYNKILLTINSQIKKNKSENDEYYKYFLSFAKNIIDNNKKINEINEIISENNKNTLCNNLINELNNNNINEINNFNDIITYFYKLHIISILNKKKQKVTEINKLYNDFYNSIIIDNFFKKYNNYENLNTSNLF